MKEGWEYKTLGECCEILNGYPFKSSLYSNSGIRVIRITNVQKGYVIDSNPKYYPESKINEISNFILKNEDILISLTGNVGRVAILQKEFLPAALNQRVACLRIKDMIVNKKFLFFYLNNDLFEKLCIKNSTGAAQLNMSTVWLKKQIIPIPSYDEQRRIVSYLDSSFKLIDEIKNKALKSLTEAKALFQSALAEAMEPKEGWEEKTLGEIATEMYRGSGIKRDQITPIGYPCLRYGEIYTTYNYSFSECISHTNESIISPKKYFEKGDILFAITGESVEDIGKCIAYTGKEKCLLGGDIVAMKHNQYPQFLAYALSTKEAIRQKGLGKVKLKVVHTNIPALKTIRIYLPNFPTQKRIVSHLDKLSSKVRAIEEKYQKMVEECDALKQAMLRDVFE